MSDWETNGGGYQKVYGENSAGTSVVLPVNGDAITVGHEVPTAWTQTAVSFGSAGTQVLAANADRLCVLLQNDSDTVMYLDWANGTHAVNQGVRLNASGGQLEMDLSSNFFYRGAINAIHAGSGDKTLLVTEGE